MSTLSNWIKKHRSTLIGGLVGVIGGLLYWHFVGCASGSCPITSSPLNSSLYGLVIGDLFGNTFKAKKAKGQE